MNKGWIGIAAIAILIVLVALAVFMFVPSNQISKGECRTSMDCKLSLCDCKCCPVGQTPK